MFVICGISDDEYMDGLITSLFNQKKNSIFHLQQSENGALQYSKHRGYNIQNTAHQFTERTVWPGVRSLFLTSSSNLRRMNLIFDFFLN